MNILKGLIVMSLMLAVAFPQAVLGEDKAVVKSGNQEASSQQKLDELLYAINQKVQQLYGEGRYDEAIAMVESLLKDMKAVVGEDHPILAPWISSLGSFYYAKGQFQEAEQLSKRALVLYEGAFGRDTYNSVAPLGALAAIYRATGRYAEAVKLRLKIIEISEKNLEKEDPQIATSIDNLAVLYANIGKYAEAEQLHKKALAIYEKAFGKDHPDVAITLNSLAVLYQTTGRFPEAEQLYSRSLQIYDKLYKGRHPMKATILDNLAVIYFDTGRYSEAESLRKQALDIYKEIFGEENHDYATTLHNLALVFIAQGKYDDAEIYLKKSVEITGKILGKSHPAIANSLDALAELYTIRGTYGQAEKLRLESLRLKEDAFGKNHPDVANSLSNLGVHYSLTGRHDEAERVYNRALEILESAFGREHPSIAATVQNLALLYSKTQKHTEAHALFKRAIIIDNKKKDDSFLLLSERQKLAYINQTEYNTHVFISHTFRHLLSDRSAVADTFDVWLKWKGAVMEAQGRYMDALYHSDKPEIKRKFDELSDVRREIVGLQISKPAAMSFGDYRKMLEQLQKKKEGLEVELGSLSKDFALEKTAGRADAKKISEMLPADSIYLDFAKINTYDFKKGEWGGPRYIVFLLMPGKKYDLRLIDIADSEYVDKLINSYLKEMKKVETGKLPDAEVLAKEAKALYDLVIKPVEPYINGKKQLFISPDGNLNLMPFEVLATREGRYLIEDYIINYISAGRDIVRFADTSKATGNALIFADPDYNKGMEEKGKISGYGGTGNTVRSAFSKDIKNISFERLPDTKDEADAIEKILNGSGKLKVRNYQGKNAVEEVLFSSETPHILHLATHGFFLKDESVKPEKTKEGMRGIKIKEVFSSGTSEQGADITIENPMLRSGIVLAGVNTSLKKGKDDGLVSAEKILGLKLKGTDLVVLSACETGIGDIQSGEGVFGLKRAFILSGAKTVVMSLWSVPSAETTEIMKDFYSLMAEGESKADALREAKLKMMKKKENPFYWAAFIMLGKPSEDFTFKPEAVLPLPVQDTGSSGEKNEVKPGRRRR